MNAMNLTRRVPLMRMPLHSTVAALLLTCAIVGGCRPAAPDATSADSTPANRPQAKDDRPWNVLLVSVDTTRADHLGCYGHPSVKTPHIDAFAKEGTLFAQCISSAPLTLPSHATMLTGSYPFVHGARDNVSFQLAPENETLAEILSAAGFATHAEVAASVLDHVYGLAQGFDEYGDMLNRDPFEDRPDATATQPSGAAQPQRPAPYISRSAEHITRYGVEFLERVGQRRFFLFLHYFDPHLPYTPPPRFAERYKDQYLAEIAYFDEQFGVLLDALRAQGLDQNTLVILTSDHGEGRGQHGEPTHSFFVYDSTVHVPLIMRAPGRIPAGGVLLSQVGLVDLAPTILDFLGLKPTPQMQGASVLPMLRPNAPDPRRAIYGDTLATQVAFGYSPLRFLRADGWKYIHAPKPELYHVAEDPGEVFDLAKSDPQRVAQMRTRLRNLIASSPPPPGGRAARKDVTADERAKLAALGYIAGDGSVGEEADDGSELDHFEPIGANPRDKLEAIQLLSAGVGNLVAGNFPTAEEIYRKLLEIEPDNARAHKELGDALAGQMKLDEALAEYRRALELNPDEVSAQAGAGTILALRGDYEAAEEQLRAAIAADPSNSGPHAGLANLLGELGRFEEALREYEVAAELAPKNYEIFLKWGKALHKLGRLEEAEQRVRQAVHLEPGIAQAHVLLANILWDAGRSDDAVGILIDLLAEHPEDTGLMRRIGDWRLRSGDPDGAVEYFRRAAEIDTDVPQAHYNLGAALLAAGQPQEAVQSLRRAVELDPEYARALTALGRALEQLRQTDEALTVYRRLVEIAPDFPHAYLSIAAMLRQRGDDAGVVEILETGLRRIPTDAGMANDLAWALATSPDDAVRDGERAVALAEEVNQQTGGKNPSVLDTLAAAYAEAGRFDDAERTLRHAIDLVRKAGDEQRAARLEERLNLYLDGRPYRSGQPD
ncbi:MAG: tetratricopeptide repeat protein [Planctomycetota bacterium]|nr:MAG: tetratricopeptide repeat protein [Planctomycetota bacterium]